jgi:phosphoglucosamine mutase
MAQEEITSEPELKRRYLEFLRDQIGKGLDLTGLKIVVDCAEGAAYELAPELFTSLGATTLAIHNSPNGRNINLNCGSLHPQELQQKVVASGADLGIAFDGDADRLMLVDERGALLDGDYIMFILAEHMRERDRLTGGRVVATVMSNLGLELSLGKLGIALTRTSVGDKFVLEELLAGGGSLGGEQSGHVIFPEISLAGDGMITALEVLRVLSQPARGSRRSLSELSEGMKRYPQVTINVPVARKPPLESVAPLREAIDALDQELLGRGRLLVRYSGTENLARVMIEGRDEQEIHHQAETLARLIQEHLGSG